MTRPPVSIVVTDANVLINLMHVSRLDLCGRLPGYRFKVPGHVLAEVTRPEQRAALEAALEAGSLEEASLTAMEGLVTYAELTERMGKGEAACIAIASIEGWSIASDEKGRFRREAIARIGAERLLGTAEIFILAIQSGLLTVDQADHDKESLEQHRFKMAFPSFRKVLGT